LRAGYGSSFWVVPEVELHPFLRQLDLEVYDARDPNVELASLSMESAQTVLEDILRDPEGAKSLRTLNLPRWSTTGLSAPMPITGLRRIATQLPDLHRLSIAADSAIFEDFSPTELSQATSELRYLHLDDTRNSWSSSFGPRDYRRIAQFLDACFPNLVAVTVSTDPMRQDGLAEHWELIEHLRQLYQALRTR